MFLSSFLNNSQSFLDLGLYPHCLILKLISLYVMALNVLMVNELLCSSLCVRWSYFTLMNYRLIPIYQSDGVTRVINEVIIHFVCIKTMNTYSIHHFFK